MSNKKRALTVAPGSTCEKDHQQNDLFSMPL